MCEWNDKELLRMTSKLLTWGEGQTGDGRGVWFTWKVDLGVVSVAAEMRTIYCSHRDESDDKEKGPQDTVLENTWCNGERVGPEGLEMDKTSETWKVRNQSRGLRVMLVEACWRGWRERLCQRRMERKPESAVMRSMVILIEEQYSCGGRIQQTSGFMDLCMRSEIPEVSGSWKLVFQRREERDQKRGAGGFCELHIRSDLTWS